MCPPLGSSSRRMLPPRTNCRIDLRTCATSSVGSSVPLFAGQRGRKERIDGHPTTEGGANVGDKTDRASGKIKETAGRVTGSPSLKQKGQDEQAKGNLKQSGKKLKEAVKKSA